MSPVVVLFAISIAALVLAIVMYVLAWRILFRARDLQRVVTAIQRDIDATLEQTRDVSARVEEWSV